MFEDFDLFIPTPIKIIGIGLLILGNLLLASWLVTEVQTHSIHLSIPYGTTTYHIDVSDGTSKSVSLAGKITKTTTGALKYSGEAVANGAKSIGSAFVWTGKSIASVIDTGARATASGIASVIAFPGHLLGHVSNTTMMAGLIKPSDAQAESVPTISAETSSSVLAHLNAKQKQKFAKYQSEQVQANRALGGDIVASSASHGGYPAKWNDIPQDSTLDAWGMYNRECVSYTAWKVNQTFGYMPYWGGVGNANQWVYDAERSGIPVGYTPRVHSVAISTNGYYGHSMWVEKVSGNMIYVSQYNYDLQGHYSEMWVSSSYLTYIYFK